MNECVCVRVTKGLVCSFYMPSDTRVTSEQNVDTKSSISRKTEHSSFQRERCLLFCLINPLGHD